MHDGSGPSPHRADANVFQRHAVAWRVLLVLVPFLVLDCTAALLMGSRGAAEFRRRHPAYHHGLVPNVESVSVWGSGEPYPVHVNSLAMFDRAVRDVPLESPRRRILFIGDSYTEGLGVPYPETFVGRIAARVDPEREEILNAGVMSYAPKLHLLRVRRLIERVGLRFDELYVFLDISDIQDEVLYAGFVPEDAEPRASPVAAAHRWLRQRSFAWWSAERLLRVREMERRLERYDARVYPPWLNYFWHDDVNEEAYRDPDFALVRAHWTVEPRILQSRWTRQGIRSAVRHMAELVALCRSHGIPVTLAVYPWTVQVEARDLDSAQVRLWRRFAEQHGTGFIDLFPTLIGQEPFAEFQERYVLPGDAHWNAAGHARVAEDVWPHVEASLRRNGATGGG